MKRLYLLVLLLVAVFAAGCSSHPNNGEIPPASEVPPPLPAATTAPPQTAPAQSTVPAKATSVDVMGSAMSAPAPASSTSQP